MYLFIVSSISRIERRGKYLPGGEKMFRWGLHQIMETNGLTRSDLPWRLGVSPVYITKVLCGNVNSSAPQHKCWGLLRVDPGRRIKHRLKAEALAPSKDQFYC